MSTMFLIYILMTIPNLVIFFGILAAIITGWAIFYSITRSYNEDFHPEKADPPQVFNGNMKRYVSAAIASFLLSFIIPDRETTYVLAGAYVAEKTVNSEIGQDVISLVHKNIKDALKEQK